MTRTLYLLSATALAISILGCSGEAHEQGEPALDWIESSPGPDISWSEFKHRATRTLDGRTYYLVEWDIALQTEEELWDYYHGIEDAQREKSIVRLLPSGADDVWPRPPAVALKYCVDTAFGSSHTRAVNEMASATLAWQNVTNVTFVYVPGENANCTPSNAQIQIPVRPWTAGGACAFFPSGGGCVTKTLVMDFNDFDTNPDWDPFTNLTTVGVFRHELGHVLGLRHEHTRPEAGMGCFEDNDWRVLTPYDPSSVMHYQWCNGVITSDLSITASDGIGIRQLYGIPVSWIGTSNSVLHN